jgi:homoserine dehydrogenase
MRLQIAYIAAAALGRVSSFTPSTAARQTMLRSASSSTSSLGMSSSSEDTITLGIFGGGTVGGGIVEILSNKADYFKQLTGKSIEVKKVCVRDASKPRDFTLPEGCSIVTSYDDILNDDSIDVAVEVMGGTTDAKDVVVGALSNGKSVVTANKALIAKDLPEIETLLSTLDSATQFRYEAAVCGGIPIIRSMQSDFVGDNIQLMCGIINGCTNFMLTAMDRDKKSYDEALSEASDLGYAEADPTLDVGGFDARSKLKILMRLAYGMNVEEDEISCRGITELTKIDFEYAKMLGGTIKLLGVAEKNDAGDVSAYVAPCYVTNEDALSSVNGATNAIEVLSDNLVSSIYIGQGAGRYPTANSCINDIVALAKGDQTPLPFNPSSDTKFVNNYESVFYLRLSYRDQVGITRQVGEVCEKHGVSIHSLLQNPVAKNQESAFAIMTDKVDYAAILKVMADIEALSWCKGKPFYMPVLRDDWQV